MYQSSELSKFFWVSMSIAYAFCFSALYTYTTIPEHTLEFNNTDQIIITMKLAIVRLVIVAIALLIYPVILFKFFEYAKYFTVALTAWAITIYIDDNFVLLGIIQYPESALISLVQLVHPILIASLLWMSIELIFLTTAKD